MDKTTTKDFINDIEVNEFEFNLYVLEQLYFVLIHLHTKLHM